MEIICLSTRRIDNPMATIVQHLMRTVGHRHRVLFVEPPADPLFLARHRSLWGRTGPSSTGTRCASAQAGLTPLIPVVLPFGERFPGLQALNRRIMLWQVRRTIARAGFKAPVLWVQSPESGWLVGRLGETRVIYYATDEYSASPRYSTPEAQAAVRAAERELLRRSDLVLVNSTALVSDKSMMAKRVELLYSGVDVEHFRRALDPHTVIPEDLARLPKPVIGFLGAVDRYKVDVQLVHYCATHSPNMTFALIGPVGWSGDTTPHDLPQAPNLVYLGRREYHTLPAYLKGCAVAMIPNARNAYTLPNFPMKLFEYFAAGKPVVATRLPALEPFAELVSLAETPEAFRLQLLQALRDNSPTATEARLAVARQHSWPACAERVEGLLAAL